MNMASALGKLRTKILPGPCSATIVLNRRSREEGTGAQLRCHWSSSDVERRLEVHQHAKRVGQNLVEAPAESETSFAAPLPILSPTEVGNDPLQPSINFEAV
jgi:hypothetical protein